MRFWLLGILLLGAAVECRAEVKVIDGDSLIVDGREIRLSGIDAPEFFQLCRDRNGKEYECGQAAMRFLVSLAGEDTECNILEKDRYKREVAVCFSRGGEINRRMVESGWAVAYNFYTHDYDDAEALARREKRGIWQGRFMRPELYRALKR